MSIQRPASRRARVAHSALFATTLVIGSIVVPVDPAVAQSPGLNGDSLGWPNIFGGDNQSQRALKVSRTEGLNNGDTLTVTGAGYPAGAAVYVAQTVAKPAVGFPTTYGEAVKVVADDNGTFSTELAVETSFGDVDCTATQCYVASFSAFPNLVDRSNDAWVPIKFAAGATPGAGSAPARPAPSRPSQSAGKPAVTLSTTELNRSGVTRITVSGHGFKNSGTGIYVAAGEKQKYSPVNSEAFAVAKWVRPSEINADGTFTTTLEVPAVSENANCVNNACALYTLAAHGSPDRSQDTATDLHVTGTAGGSSSGSTGGNGSTGSAPGTGGTGSAPGTGSTGSAGNSSASGSGTSTSGATVTLSKTTGLNPSGDTIQVTGRGFSTSGPGLYVGIAQNNQMDVTNADSFGPDTQFVSTGRGNLRPDGSFTITLPVSAQFGSANCMTNPCSVFTIAAHGSSDRSQDTATPVSFAGGVEKQQPALPGGGSAAGPNPGSSGNSGSAGAGGGAGNSGSGSSSTAPSVSLSTTTLSPTGTTAITVSGSGFKNSGPGIYVTAGEKAKFSPTNADNFAAAVFVRSSAIGSDGSFSTTIEVPAVSAAANCVDNACAIFTMAAHGSSDRSQDTVTDLTVGGTEAQREQARKEAEKAARGVKADGSPSGRGSASSGDDSVADTEGTLAAASSPWTTLATGGLGAVLGALIFGAGMWFGGRRKPESSSLEDA